MEEKAILEKLDRILEILGEGRGRSTADLRRQAEADVIRLKERSRTYPGIANAMAEQWG